MTKQPRNPKRSAEDLKAANDAKMRANEIARAAVHIRSAQLEVKLGDLASAASNLREAAEIYGRHAGGETVEIDAE